MSASYSLNHLQEMSGGDDNFVKEMVEMFLINTPTVLEELNTAFESQDWPNVKAHSHKLKPSIDLMEINQLKKEIRRIHECAGKETNLEEVPELMKLVNSVLKTVFLEMKEGQLS